MTSEELVVETIRISPGPDRAHRHSIEWGIARFLIDVLGNGVCCTQIAGLPPGIPEPLNRQLGESLRDAFATVLGMR